MSWERPPPGLARPLAPWIAELRGALRAIGRERVSWVNWWRSSSHNARVGGAPTSQHLLGLAVDVVPIEPRARARIAQALRTAGLVVIDEGDHLHVQLSAAGTWDAVIARAKARGLL